VLAALETGIYPASGQLEEEDRLTGLGMIEVAPVRHCDDHG
jgi:hypothetical protein